MSCRKQGDLGRNRQRWCRESSLNLATDVWLSFVSGNRGQGQQTQPLTLEGTAHPKWAASSTRGTSGSYGYDSILDPVNLGRGTEFVEWQKAKHIVIELLHGAPQRATEKSR
jgi:hypothetical protein